MVRGQELDRVSHSMTARHSRQTTRHHHVAGVSPRRDSSAQRPRPWLAIVFTATSFASAGLLFSIEPMIGKLLLPLYGGSAEVWTTCMLFFQVMLLAGYAYAHVASRRLRTDRHAWIHLLLCAVAGLSL